MHSVDPPAIVREQDRLEEMPATAKAMYAALKKSEGKNLEQALSLGRLLLEIKKKTAHGKWAEQIDAIDIPIRTAQDYMMIAKCAAPRISECDSIREAVHMAQAVDALCAGCYHNLVFKGLEPVRGCKDCKKKKTMGRLKKKKQGEAVFDWKIFEQHYQFVNCTAELLAKHYPQIKGTPAYRAWDDHLNSIITIAKEWHEQLIKGK